MGEKVGLPSAQTKIFKIFHGKGYHGAQESFHFFMNRVLTGSKKILKIFMVRVF